MEFTINNIIELIRYFAPGLIFLYIFRYVTNKDDKLQMDGNNFVVIVLISYIALNTFVAIISMCGVTTYSIESKSLSFWDAILVGIICLIAIGSGLIRNSSWIEKNILAKFLHRTYNDNVWESLKDIEKRTQELNMFVLLNWTSSIKSNIFNRIIRLNENYLMEHD